eukprot:GHVL01005640.1.p1 GENE.GHVL01005640.1~~GHVL01005640.1.p1  ORF type:complete len:285 (+),score=54.06 GHVL01005640.1:48-902(+)
MLKALLLVGGYGTRLRPLTLSKPKPLIEFCNISILEHQIAAAVETGVEEIILAVSYRPQALQDVIPSLEEKYGISIKISIETHPLGTAGPIKLAENLLENTQYFFVFNSDVICDFPLKDMLNFHKSHKQEGTLLVTRVSDPSKYGVVVTDDDGKIQKFVEKPSTFVGDRINAGIYLFSPTILKRINLRPTSIEREIFPSMAEEDQLSAMTLTGYWADIGQPKDFLHGSELYLQSAPKGKYNPTSDHPHCSFIEPVLVDKSANFGKNCLIGPNVVIGPNCVIGDG